MGIIGLLTDYGTEDGYVGAIKGRILRECPSATIVDISHHIAPFDVKGASFCLNTACHHYPKGTIFIGIVDPGVAKKDDVLVVYGEDYTYIVPDNELLSIALMYKSYDAYKVNLDDLNWHVNHGFHGRDVFAPLAGRIASDLSIKDYLTPIPKIKTFVNPLSQIKTNVFDVNVLHVDHFGNVILNFHKKDWENLKEPHSVKVQIDHLLITDIKENFGNAPNGTFLLTWECSGYLKISQRYGHAADELGIEVNDIIQLSYA